MNDPKLPLTPVQLGLTLLNGAGLIFCAGGDVFLLMFDRGTVRHSAVIMNLALAVIVAVMCGVLVVKAGDIDLFDKGELRDKKPAVGSQSLKDGPARADVFFAAARAVIKYILCIHAKDYSIKSDRRV